MKKFLVFLIIFTILCPQSLQRPQYQGSFTISFNSIKSIFQIIKLIIFDEETIVLEMNLAKGFISGVHEGFYDVRSYQPDEKCLGITTLNKIKEIEYNLINKIGIETFLDLILAILDIAYSIDTYCEVGKLLTDIVYQIEREGVKSEHITNNLMILGLELMAEISETTQIMKDISTGEIYNMDESIDRMESIGTNYGKEFRIILGFNSQTSYQ